VDDRKPPIRMTPAFFFLMLALADGSRHGHAMGREVEERSGGSVKLGPGSLYWSIGRLADVGLIEEVDSPENEADERRRYYALTPLGREVLSREAATLERIVEYARVRRIV
jgi:DNA-binding PadR family transcriptional regulator